MGPRKLLVFDLETVPDVALGRALHPDWQDFEDIAVRAKLSAAALEKSQNKSDFLNPAYHKIVGISCLMADIEPTDAGESYHLRKLWSVGTEGDGEAALISLFLNGAGKDTYRLVSYNGLNFDLTTLRLRALKHGIAAPWLFGFKDKWKNHFTKSSPDFHEDLADVFGVRGLKMDELCKMCHLPGKMDVDGTWVADLIAAGKLADVRAYCETDVLNTYLLYLKYKHICGVLAPETLHRSEHQVVDYLLKEGEHQPHFKAFLDRWMTVAPQKT